MIGGMLVRLGCSFKLDPVSTGMRKLTVKSPIGIGLVRHNTEALPEA